MLKIKQLQWLVILLIGINCGLTPQAASDMGLTRDINPVKIEFADPVLARKIAISYHHAILEANYQAGYLIADLTAQEINQLRVEKVRISTASKWKANIEAILKNANANANEHEKNNRTALLKGIEGYDCYPTVEETYQSAQALADNNPDLASWIDIGDSWNKANGLGGYDIMVLKITNQAIAEEKPKLFIQSSMHAREYTPAALTLDFAKLLLNNYENDADIRWIVDYHEVHILFQMNPDGRKIAENQIFQRKNTNQNHCPQDSVGVDLNRNFAFTWNVAPGGSSGEECNETYRGAFAESEPETKAVSDYIRALYSDNRGPDDDDAAPLNTSGMHLDIHSYSQLVLWPYGHKQMVSPNNAGFVELGNKLAWFNGYTAMQSIGLYATDGTSDSVSYGELGVAAITFELGTQFFQSCSVYNAQVKPDNLAALKYAAKVIRAPYLLSYGPEITNIELNGVDSGLTISQGTPVNIAATASAMQSKLDAVGRTISRVIYSLDLPPWDESAEIVELIENDGNVGSGVETLSGQLDTSLLNEGQHILYVQAYNQNAQVGVTSAAFFSISTNNSPTPVISVQCNFLNCQFDASSSNDVDGTITSYQWDFNGEADASGITANYNFSSAGEKSIRLTLTDNSANIAEKLVDITVSLPPPEVEQTGGGGGVWGLLMLFCACVLRGGLSITKVAR